MAGESFTSAGDLLQAAARLKANRAVFEYTVPTALAQDTGIQTIGIVQLTGGEELMASRRCQGNLIQLSYELAKEALKQLNGKVLEDGEADVFWANPANAKLRTLVVTAFNVVNQPTQDDAASFLASRTVKVG